MPTRRERMIALLEGTEYTPRALAGVMRMRVQDALDHLEHVRQSVDGRLQVRAAYCKSCGFEFDTRDKLSTPSRCPECRAERIAGPWLSIGPE